MSSSESERDLGAEALELAGVLERFLGGGEIDVLPPEAVQALLAVASKFFTAHREEGVVYDAIGANGITPTDVMVTASALLKAANLQVFELGMWQNYTGR